MKPQRPGSAALFVAVLLVLGLDVAARREEDPGPPLPTVASFELDAPRRVRLVRQEQVVLLERDPEGVWQVREPYLDRADQSAVLRLLGGLGRAGAALAPVDEGNDEPYGLSGLSPVRVTVEGADGVLADLYLGAPSPTGSTFVRLAGQEEIWLAQVGSRAVFDREPGAWRDRRLVALDPQAIRGLELGPLLLAREEAGWRAVRPEGLALDPKRVEAAVVQLAELEAELILGPEAPALPSPTFPVVIDHGVGREAFELAVLDGAVHGRRADGRRFLLRTELGRLLMAPLDSWRDRALVRLDIALLRRMALEEAGLTSVLVRPDGGAWALERPPGVAIDPRAAAQTARYLTELDVARWAEAPAPFVPTAALQLDDLRLEIGGRVPGRASGQEALYIRRADQPERVGELPARVWVALKAAWGR